MCRVVHTVNILFSSWIEFERNDLLEFFHVFADNLQWHQWAPEESGNHSSQDCSVQEEADGSVSQGAAGTSLTPLWSPFLSHSFHPLILTPMYSSTWQSFSFFFFSAGINQAGNSEKKRLCYSSRWGTSPRPAGHHSVWTQRSHSVQGKYSTIAAVQKFKRNSWRIHLYLAPLLYLVWMFYVVFLTFV